MSENLQDKILRLPVVGWIAALLKEVRLPGFEGLTLYDLSEMYLKGIVQGALTYRAGAIAFSFFMALFPFLLFVLNLLPYVPINDFQAEFIDLIESLLPPKTAGYFHNVIEDIVSNQRGGLLSSVFFLSIILMANGVNAIFNGFESSYHTAINRKMIRQYMVSIGVALLLVLITLVAVIVFVYLQFLRIVEPEGGDGGGVIGIQLAKGVFFVFISYIITATLYYFGTAESKETRFFSPGALMTTILLVVTTYLFGIYINNFALYNELYGSIGGLLILMLYIWLNSNLLLLGFELNAALRSLKRNF